MTFDLARTDTICALATANAPAAIALIRVSGARAHDVRARVFRSRARTAMRPRVATLGDVVDEQGDVDEALCTSFHAPASYTGEDGFELTIHGGPVLVKRALKALVAAGCRLAEPGEMTLRAVLTGRMDLAAAEAVDDVIRAKSEAGARAALRVLRGGLRDALAPVRAAVVDALAEIEARLDYPDEPLGDARTQAIARDLASARERLTRLIDSAALGERLRRGARVVLFGAPNAGKSTLFNALLGEERALVHDEPGTTRDVIEAAVEWDGIEVTLVDVAGVREVDAGAVERMGITRAYGERERADVVLALTPANAARESAPSAPSALAVITKSDLAPALRDAPEGALAVSAKTGAGLAELQRAIVARLHAGHAGDDEVLVMRERQTLLAREANESVTRAIHALARSEFGEVIASELRAAAKAIDRMQGGDVSADVLDAIFTRFCIGK